MNIINEKGKTFSITLGMANALKKGDKLKWKKVCHSCGFNMPSYAGSYPVNCPICGVAFDTTNEEYMIYQQDGTPVGAVMQNEAKQSYLWVIVDKQDQSAFEKAIEKSPWSYDKTDKAASTLSYGFPEKTDTMDALEIEMINYLKKYKLYPTFELEESTKINEADEAQQLAAAKKWILRNVEITGKSKKDPEELEAMKQLMKIKTFKELWSTLEKKHLFDKHAIKQLKMDLVDIMMDALGDKRA